MVRDREERAGRERFDSVALDAEVLAVEAPGHAEQAGRRVEPEAEALGRPPLEQAGARELCAHVCSEGEEPAKADGPDPAASRRSRLPLDGCTRDREETRGRRHHSIRIGCRA